MSNFETSEVRNHEAVREKSSSPARIRCRIPQRLGSPRPKMDQNLNKPINPQVVTIVQNLRVQRQVIRPRSESRSRSTNRSDSSTPRQMHAVRPTWPERIPLPVKKAPLSKKPFNLHPSKVRVTNVQKFTRSHRVCQDQLPDQETIQKREVLEIQASYGVEDEPSEVLKIKANWAERLSQFTKLKTDLEYQQRNLMEVYAALRNTHKAMSALGQNVSLPAVDDLKIMNVAKLTPEQLLQLCAGAQLPDTTMQKGPSTIEMNKLFEMPAKLVATCEQTLHKRKEIIDWFQSLKTEQRGISIHKLTKKINEFNAENEMLACSLKASKAEFTEELNDVVEFLRRCVNETIALQLRTEELTYQVSELNAQNADLRKQLQNTEHFKSVHNRHRVEELEKELKEEKCKKIVIKDRLTRAEGQIKIGNDRAAQLESALEQARSRNWTLERTVQQLNDQNQKLQSEFDKELLKLTESIKDNTTHLQEIADARKKLQTEKEALENRLQELSDFYNESLAKMKEELDKNITTLQETEQKFEDEKDERKKLETNLESLCAQLFESEIRYKELIKQMQEKSEAIGKMAAVECELNATKQILENVTNELEDYKNRMQKQTENVQEIERNFKETINLERTLRVEIKNKENYISEIEKQLRDSEYKMESYEKQLNSLKSQIAQVLEEFGEFENINQLHEMINQQRDKLLETSRQNDELANALQQRDMELENHLEHLAKQEQLIEQRDNVIKMLTDKENEQVNIIKLLRNNLEMRAQADAELSQQLAEKNAEIDALVSNVETRKQQISQLEKIILTLEDQLRKVHLQRRREQEKMLMLEKAITDYDMFPMDIKPSMEAPNNLDYIIKTLEQELDAFDLKHNRPPLKNKLNSERKTVDRIEICAVGRNEEAIFEEDDSTEPVPRNPKNNSGSHERDNLDRKKAITNMETQKWLPNSEPINVYTSSLEKKLPPFKGMVPVVQVMAGQRDDKKCKMFKLAGHNL